MRTPGFKRLKILHVDKRTLENPNQPPDPIKLRGSSTTYKEVDGKKVPVLGDDDQRVPGPDEPWRRRTGVKVVHRGEYILAKISG